MKATVSTNKVSISEMKNVNGGSFIMAHYVDQRKKFLGRKLNAGGYAGKF